MVFVRGGIDNEYDRFGGKFLNFRHNLFCHSSCSRIYNDNRFLTNLYRYVSARAGDHIDPPLNMRHAQISGSIRRLTWRREASCT
jgi:hypothetical protein